MPRVILVNLRAKNVDRLEVLSAHVGFSFGWVVHRPDGRLPGGPRVHLCHPPDPRHLLPVHLPRHLRHHLGDRGPACLSCDTR